MECAHTICRRKIRYCDKKDEKDEDRHLGNQYQKKIKRYNINALKEGEKKENLKKEENLKTNALTKEQTVETNWKNMETNIKPATEKVIGYSKQEARKPKDVFVVFIDYQKVFDSIKHKPLLEILQQIGFDTKDTTIIQSLYWNQSAKLRMNNSMSTEELEITNGIALHDQTRGIKINGIPINSIRYADDTAILAGNIEDLQTLLNNINTLGK
ncbi:hypothetical protein ILUMI_07664 [Ignelater luminosus]|uniref:Reverse transcriptase domain-containing protein n=1 Tax=Ignelater luminosus TaxID=2038154 RepID=A0A8K0GE62_IGNLU|nr:hypothetical protein ILUMI_07664 [Ignelater luminosus]